MSRLTDAVGNLASKVQAAAERIGAVQASQTAALDSLTSQVTALKDQLANAGSSAAEEDTLAEQINATADQIDQIDPTTPA